MELVERCTIHFSMQRTQQLGSRLRFLDLSREHFGILTLALGTSLALPGRCTATQALPPVGRTGHQGQAWQPQQGAATNGPCTVLEQRSTPQRWGGQDPSRSLNGRLKERALPSAVAPNHPEHWQAAHPATAPAVGMLRRLSAGQRHGLERSTSIP